MSDDEAWLVLTVTGLTLLFIFVLSLVYVAGHKRPTHCRGCGAPLIEQRYASRTFDEQTGEERQAIYWACPDAPARPPGPFEDYTACYRVAPPPPPDRG